MERPSLEAVVQRLTDWRVEAIERLRAGDPAALADKLALDAAIRWLEVCEKCQLPADGEVIHLPALENRSFAQYRVLWDWETEDRLAWKEVERASPGDLLIKLP